MRATSKLSGRRASLSTDARRIAWSPTGRTPPSTPAEPRRDPFRLAVPPALTKSTVARQLRALGGQAARQGSTALAVARGHFHVALDIDVLEPAAACGVVGFSPSAGMLSLFGLRAGSGSSVAAVGLLAQTVRRLGWILVRGGLWRARDARDPGSMTGGQRFRCAKQREGYGVGVGAGVRSLAYRGMKASQFAGLTFGVPREYEAGELDIRVYSAWMRAQETVQRLGAKVVPVSLPNTQHALSKYYDIAPAEASSDPGDSIRAQRTQVYEIQALVQRDYDSVFKLSNPLYKPDQFDLTDLPEDMELEDKKGPAQIDFLLCPTVPTANPNIMTVDIARANDILTVPATLAGVPTISIPVPGEDEKSSKRNLKRSRHHQSSDNVGIQLTGQFWDDARLLGVAQTLREELRANH